MEEIKIYDEVTKEEIENPDLEKGYLYNGKIKIGTEPEKIVVMDGTVSERNPSGLRRVVPETDIYEECKYYHKYTESEIGLNSYDYVTWTELAAAYKKGVELA